MDVRTRSEVGMKNAEPFRSLAPKPAENPAGLPGTPDTDRLIKDVQKGSQSVVANQSKDHFKVSGTQVDMIA